jgi:iron complex outermembrane receptor protein
MKKARLLAGAAMFVIIGGPAAVAAEAAPTGAGATTAQVETLIVTAQKRAENIQDVPLAVTAVSGDSLRQQHIEQLQELRFLDTSLQYRVSTGPNTSAFAVRGVGTSSFSSGIEQSVSTVLDGVVLADPSSVQTLADIDHVEILRGPQGMLFGKNASAGVISITTTDPKIGLLEGAAHLSYGEHNEQILQGIVNVPISDTLAARLVVTHNHLDGWVHDPVLGGRAVNPIDIDAVRGKLLFKPNDDLRVVLSADASYTGEFCCSQMVRYAPDPHTGVAVANAQFGVVAGPSNYQVADGAAPTGFGRVYGGSAQIDYSLPKGFSLTSITGYRRSVRSNFYDADFAPFNFADVNGGSSDASNWSQEIRLTSPTNERFDYVLGAYYYQAHILGTIGQIGFFNNPTIDTITIPPAGQILASNSQTSDVHSKDYAVFGQGRLHFNDQLSLIAGARYTRDDLTLGYTASGLDHTLPLRGLYPATGFPANSYIGFNGPYVTPCVTVAVLPARPNCFPAINQKTNADNVSWRIGFEEQFAPDIMGYATASRGYKGPGFSSLTITAQNIINGQADQTIRPEIPTSYEIGLKTQLFDRRVVLNVDVFDTTYKNFQAQVSTPTPNGFVSIIHNAGEVTTKGVEATLAAKLNEQLTLNLNGSYIKARYGAFPGVSCYVDLSNPATGATVNQPDCTTAANATPTLAAGTINARGHRLAGSPDYQYKAALNYVRPDTFGGWTAYADANWYWQSSVQYQASGDPKSLQPAFGMLGGSVGLGAPNEKWRLSLYATNVLDKHWAANISPAPTAALNPGGEIQYLSPDSFRHVGVRLDAKF